MKPAFCKFLDLASEKMEGQALFANDDFFAPKENLLKDSTPVFIADKYTDRGKWMDGWESRRKRGIDSNSHDYCIIRLGSAGVIYGIDVDTSHFVGNFPQFASIEGTRLAPGENEEKLQGASYAWQNILSKKSLKGGRSNFFPISNKNPWTHVKLNIFPDGGVARLRVYGEVKPDWERLINNKGAYIDLAAAQNGGRAVACNDMFFGGKDNLIMPGKARTMGEGWETKRKRGIGDNSHDWIIIQLGHPGRIKKTEVDTNHFKGNFPESCSIEGLYSPKDIKPSDLKGKKLKWVPILDRAKLQAHHQHMYEKELNSQTGEIIFSHLRLNIFPDGGISRLRAYGEPCHP